MAYEKKGKGGGSILMHLFFFHLCKNWSTCLSTLSKFRTSVFFFAELCLSPLHILSEGEKKALPNQQRTLKKLPPELRRGNFVNKQRLSIQIGTKRAKTCTQCVDIPTELPFCIPPLVVGFHHPLDGRVSF